MVNHLRAPMPVCALALASVLAVPVRAAAQASEKPAPDAATPAVLSDAELADHFVLCLMIATSLKASDKANADTWEKLQQMLAVVSLALMPDDDAAVDARRSEIVARQRPTFEAARSNDDAMAKELSFCAKQIGIHKDRLMSMFQARSARLEKAKKGAAAP